MPMNPHFCQDFSFLSGLMNSFVVSFLYFDTWNQAVFCKQGYSDASAVLFFIFYPRVCTEITFFFFFFGGLQE